MLAFVAPPEIVLLGLIRGSATALTAAGLVLVWRSNRILNFSTVAIGAVAGGAALNSFAHWHVPYFAAIGVAVAVGAIVGLVTEVAVIGRFRRSTRLVVTVATIGLAQLLGGLDLLIGRNVFGENGILSGARTTPLSRHRWNVGVVLVDGNHLLVLVVVPLVTASLAWFLRRTAAGVAVRGAAENDERARLLGIGVNRLQSAVWAIAGGLAALTFVLQAPFTGSVNSAVTGPTLLLPALAAAVIARMESLPIAFGASLALGAIDQVVRWNASSPQVVDVVLLVVILVALATVRRPALRRGTDDGWTAADIATSMPAVARRLPEVRIARWAGAIVVVGAAVVAPFVLSSSSVATLSVCVVWGMVALSLVVLSGWAGQISLGQFAFAGAGAMVTANLVASAGIDLFLALLAAGAVTGIGALVMGVPALRISGPFLAVVTLAFAQVVNDYLLNPNVFPSVMPTDVPRPVLLDRWSMEDERVMYWFALGVLAFTVAAVRAVHRTRSGRVLRATRDHRSAAECAGVGTTHRTLSAFVLSGVVAGVAGGLEVLVLHGAPYGTFPTSSSIEVFSRATIGGIGSIAGALTGTMGLRALDDVVGQELRFVLGGTGLLVILWLVPGGFAQLGRRLRDAVVGRVLARRRVVPGGIAPGPTGPVPPAALPTTQSMAQNGRAGGESSPVVLHVSDVEVSYGPLQVLFGVSLEVRRGEVFGLLGTNGAGKSTLLRAVCGLTRSTGSIGFEGRQLRGLPPERIARSGVALMSGGHATFPSLTVAENLRLACWTFRRDRARCEASIAEVLARFDALAGRQSEPAGNLSGGLQQQLALAMTLMLRPEVLLIDELSLGLSPSVAAELVGIVRDLRDSGMTIVVVEQSVDVALDLADRVAFMEKGETRFVGESADLAGRTDLLRAVFLSPDPGDGDRAATGPWGTVATDTAVLRCAGVTRRFGGVVAVDDVSLAVAPREIVGLIGQNGAGKTTLLDILTGLQPADGGVIALQGREITGWSTHRRARSGLGRSFQEARLFPSLTVAETLAVACERHVRSRSLIADALRQPASLESELDVAERVRSLLSTLGLREHATKPTSTLSTGMRRLVELGCLIAAGSSVLLLDEPSAGVAQREAEALAPVLRRIRDETGAALVVIEHDMALISSIADRLVALDLGRVIADGPPADVLADPAVVAAYLGSSASSGAG